MNKNSNQTETIVSAEPVPFPDEITHLKMINDKLDAALKKANLNVERANQEYMDAKRYMSDYRGEIDPHEMLQNELMLRQTDHTGALAVGIWKRLIKLKESPYFARIDFRPEEKEEVFQYYIGRFTFNYENELLIFDWRSPVASMFYDYETGPAGYDAPVGRMNGELIRKRQFKVKNGILEYVLESSENIQDDVLQRELSHTSDEKMKSIISTIQKEQNQIIRDEKPGTMIIQGAAGSGKTSIALHRIAFLLYRCKDRLSAQNITIISPNKVFGDYISTVLPELGEEPICELGIAEITEDLLNGAVQVQAEKDPLEGEDAAWAERVRFKSTLDFVRRMEEFLDEMPALVFDPEEYQFGRFRASADFIQSRFQAYRTYPVKRRLMMAAEDIYDRFESDNFMEDDLPRPKTILKSLNKMLKIKNSLALYKEFYRWMGLPKLLVLPAKKTLEWEDAAPFLYLHAAYEGVQENKFMKHLVIDEMQDYTPIQFAVINRLYPCSKTILGDFGQFIHPYHQNTLEDLRQMYPDAGFAELTKSYRSTYEIITFAREIQRTGRLEPVERHGEAPVIISCRDAGSELSELKKQIYTFQKSEYSSFGIILKTNTAAKAMYKELSKEHDIHLISPESTRFTNGVSITSVQMSKGLEFDMVTVPDVNADIYKTEYDRGLLYIASTRAMHLLTILYTGEPSALLPKRSSVLTSGLPDTASGR